MFAFSIIACYWPGLIVAQDRCNRSMTPVLQRIHSSTLRRKAKIQLPKHAHVEGPLWAVQVVVMVQVGTLLFSWQEHIHLVLHLIGSLPGAENCCWLCRCAGDNHGTNSGLAFQRSEVSSRCMLCLHSRCSGLGESVQVTVMGFIVGSLFSNQGHDPSDARNYFGVSFVAIMFLSFGAQPELSISFGMKP
jgi:hypothetical protein